MCQECPTLWRIYEYVSNETRLSVLASREEKSELGIGNGGEGYIAQDEWCYCCGSVGHLGDVSAPPSSCTLQNADT
jgi:protein AIR1/2